MTSVPLLEIKGVSKFFGRTQALSQVNFSVYKGEIVGLVGDNGAGKSTLIKIITGIYRPDEGDIYWEGNKVPFMTPTLARRLGIECVYQDLALVPSLSVVRNFFLGKECIKNHLLLKFLGVLDLPTMRKICKKELEKVGIRSLRSVDEPVKTLSGGERQAVALTSAVFHGAKLVLLDEPTAALSVRETHTVHELIRNLKQNEIGVVYVSHNIYHVYEVADKIVVLEHGKVIGEYQHDQVKPEDIIALIKNGTTP